MTTVDLFVNGTLMRGLALHANLQGAELVEEASTAPRYRLYSIGPDLHPGMFEVSEGGVSVPGEIYRVPADVLAAVEAAEPPGLYRGAVTLADGRSVAGILYPKALAVRNGTDISDHGGWRAYVAARSARRSSHHGSTDPAAG